METLYRDQALCGRQVWGQGVEAGGLDTLPLEQQADGEGRRGCERQQGHRRTQGTWLGRCPFVSGSWHSSVHVQLILQSS